MKFYKIEVHRELYTLCIHTTAKHLRVKTSELYSRYGNECHLAVTSVSCIAYIKSKLHVFCLKFKKYFNKS